MIHSNGSRNWEVCLCFTKRVEGWEMRGGEWVGLCSGGSVLHFVYPLEYVLLEILCDDLWKWGWKLLSCVWLFVTLWSIQFLEFPRQEYWSGQPFPSPGDLPNPGIEPRSSMLQVGSLPAEPPGKPEIIFKVVLKLVIEVSNQKWLLASLEVGLLRFCVLIQFWCILFSKIDHPFGSDY